MTMFNYEDCTVTLRDVRKSCDIILNILNDLHYDKLEDGQMVLDTKKIIVLPFIVESVNSLLLMGREKNIQLLFDADDEFLLDPYRNRWKNEKLVGKNSKNNLLSRDTSHKSFFENNNNNNNNNKDNKEQSSINSNNSDNNSCNSNNSLLSSTNGDLNYKEFIHQDDYVEADEKKIKSSTWKFNF